MLGPSCFADFKFPMFNANLTLNYGPFDKRATNGMIGETIGEGHYGLVIMGDTNVRFTGAVPRWWCNAVRG
jgi:hypothetical protein